MLTADLASDEREAWAAQLDTWVDELASYTREPPFRAAAAAADRGWDEDRLRRVLDDTEETPRLWEDERPWYADDVELDHEPLRDRPEPGLDAQEHDDVFDVVTLVGFVVDGLLEGGGLAPAIS